jgi:hypothetical protein
VLATIPSYLAVAQVETGTTVPVHCCNNKGTELRSDEWFQTLTAFTTAVLWPDFAYCKATFSQTQNFGFNQVFE